LVFAFGDGVDLIGSWKASRILNLPGVLGLDDFIDCREKKPVDSPIEADGDRGERGRVRR
jgi:hypothetical protein